MVDPDLTIAKYAELFVAMFDGFVGTINRAMAHPDLVREFDKGFDVVINYETMGGPEDLGIYLAEKFKAPLVYFSTAQGPTSRLSHFIGQPFHPAYMFQPGVVTLDELSFLEKVVNSLMVLFNEGLR